MYQISLKSKKFFMDGRTDIWDPLLGWLGGVNLKTKDRYSRLLRHPAWTKRWECVNCRELTSGGLADSCSRLWISERSSVRVVSNWPACRSVMSTVSGDHSSRRPSTSRWSRCSCRNTSRTSCLNYTRTHTHGDQKQPNCFRAAKTLTARTRNKIIETRRSQHSQVCQDPRQQCFCASWTWPFTTK